MTLQGLAQSAVSEGRGRVVKLLGDGVMMRFESILDGVRSTLALMATVNRARLPPAQAGIANGPFIARDGDLSGHTVNLASRIATSASPGELLIPREHARLLDLDEFTWHDAGVASLKGVPNPVSLIRVARRMR